MGFLDSVLAERSWQKTLISFMTILCSTWTLNWVVTIYIRYNVKYRKRCSLPVVNLKGWNFTQAEAEYLKSSSEILRKGRDLYGSTGFQIFTPEGYVVIIPESWAEELKAVDDSIADSLDSSTRSLLGGYTWYKPGLDPLVIQACQKHLTTQLGSLKTRISEEIGDCLTRTLTTGDEWTPYPVTQLCINCISTSVSATYVPKSIANDPLWQFALVNASLNWFWSGAKIRQYSYLGKVLTTAFGTVKEMQMVWKCQRDMRQILTPVVRTRMATDPKVTKNDESNDMVQWIYDELKGEPGFKPEDVANQVLNITYPAMLTAISTLLNLVYDLLYYPEHLAGLRQEIDEVWESCDGQWDFKATRELRKLDSFMKESHRLSDVNHVTMNRTIQSRSGFTFSSGLHLPYKTDLAVNQTGMSADPKTHEDPMTFHGFRWLERSATTQPSLGGTADEKPTHQQSTVFTSANPRTSMEWGYGRHSCVGRFFTGFEMKLILAHLLRGWDIGAEEADEKTGVGMGKGVGRPRGTVKGGRTEPVQNVRVMVRKRQGVV